MTTGVKRRIQRDILRRRGLGTKEQGHLKTNEVPPPDGIKTSTMRQIEARFGVPLEELLMRGNQKEVAQFLGVEASTISKWRLRLGLRGSKAGTVHGS